MKKILYLLLLGIFFSNSFFKAQSSETVKIEKQSQENLLKSLEETNVKEKEFIKNKDKLSQNKKKIDDLDKEIEIESKNIAVSYRYLLHYSRRFLGENGDIDLEAKIKTIRDSLNELNLTKYIPKNIKVLMVIKPLNELMSKADTLIERIENIKEKIEELRLLKKQANNLKNKLERLGKNIISALRSLPSHIKVKGKNIISALRSLQNHK